MIILLLLLLLLLLLSSSSSLYCISGRVGAVAISASQSWGTQLGPRPGRGLNIWVTFFPAKAHSTFDPSGVGKMSASIHELL